MSFISSWFARQPSEGGGSGLSDEEYLSGGGESSPLNSPRIPSFLRDAFNSENTHLETPLHSGSPQISPRSVGEEQDLRKQALINSGPKTSASSPAEGRTRRKSFARRSSSARSVSTLTRPSSDDLTKGLQDIANTKPLIELEGTQNAVTMNDEIYVPLPFAKQQVQQYIHIIDEMKAKYISSVEELERYYKDTEQNYTNQMKSFVSEYQTKYKALQQKHHIENKEVKDKEVETDIGQQEFTAIMSTPPSTPSTTNSSPFTSNTSQSSTAVVQIPPLELPKTAATDQEKKECDKCLKMLEEKRAMLINFNDQFLILEKTRENEIESLLLQIEQNKKQYKDNLESVEKEVNILLKQLEDRHREELAEALKVISERSTTSESQSDLEKENHKLTVLVRQLESDRSRLIDSQKKHFSLLESQIKSLTDHNCTLESSIEEKTKLADKLEYDIKLWKERFDRLEKEQINLIKALEESQENILWKEKYEQASREIEHKDRIEVDLEKNVTILEESIRVKDRTTQELDEKLEALQKLYEELQDKFNREHDEIASLREEKKNIDAMKNAWNQEKTELQRIIDKQAKQMTEEKEGSQIDLERVHNIIKEQFERIEMLEQENHDLLIKRALENTQNSQAEQIDKYKRLLTKYKATNNQHKDNANKLQKELKTLMEENAKLSDLNTEFSNKYEEIKCKYQQGNAHLEQKDHIIGSLQARIDILNDEIDLYKDNDPERRADLYKELERKLSLALSDKSTFTKEMDDVKYELLCAQQDLEREKKALEDYKKIQQQHEELSNRASLLEVVNAELKKNTEMDNRKVRGDYESKLKEVNDELSLLKQFVENSDEHIKSTKTNIHAITVAFENAADALNSTPSDPNNLKKIAKMLHEQKETCDDIETRLSNILELQAKLKKPLSNNTDDNPKSPPKEVVEISE